MYRILQISDLHRSHDDPITNKALIAALDSDFTRQKNEDPAIGSIDAVIVCGDIIQGSCLGNPSYADEINSQYQIALEFLSEVADRYLKGARSQIVIVPGNHDVDWNTAFSKMKEVPEATQDINLNKYLGFPNTPFRFCYKTRRLYHIEDLVGYEERFRCFNEFISRFYENSDLQFPLHADNSYNLFRLDGSKIVVAGFNSCLHNDCFNPVGNISDKAIGDAYLKVKDTDVDHLLAIAVWHHSVNGPPTSNDYMDINHVREMASRGFKLGFHGHQHKMDVFPDTVRLPGEEQILVVSAGSLCVGPSELPVGERRQYNVIEISDDYSSVRIHAREMIASRTFRPRYLHDFGGNSYADFKLSDEATLRKYSKEKTLQAEKLIAEKSYNDAANFLLSERASETEHGRRLLYEACFMGKLFDVAIENLNPPSSISELFFLVDALCDKNRHDSAIQIVRDSGAQLHLPQSQQDELLEQIELQMVIKK